jgi:hypothetical protein
MHEINAYWGVIFINLYVFIRNYLDELRLILVFESTKNR